MPSDLLTDTAIRRAKPAETLHYLQDGNGLMLRIRPDGRRDWMWRYTSPTTGKRETLYPGSYPALTLKAVREFVQKRRELVAKGIDPKRATAVVNDDTDAIPTTVSELFGVWFKKEITPHRKSQTDHQSIQGRFSRYVLPAIGDVSLTDVRRPHVLKSIEPAREGKKLRTANLVLSELRQMFVYAVAREWMQGDPTAGIKRRDAGGQDKEGDRVLSDGELSQLRDALARPTEQRTKYYTARRRVLPVRSELMLWWTLATAARAVEVASIKRRGDVDVEARTWDIPSDVAKNGRAHTVHLSGFALAIWTRFLLLPAGDSPYLFVGREGGHVSERELTRRLTDRQTRTKKVKGRKNTTELDLPGGHWTQHDLRRTAATIMGELGIPEGVVDRCLNHIEPKKVTRTYQRQQMLVQRRDAFDALGAHLTNLLGDPAEWLPWPNQAEDSAQ